eukprot:5399240-Pyramimonas_sp.AAC.1
MDEAAHELGFSVAVLLLDLKKLYDSISLLKLMQIALSQSYPAVVAPLEVQMFLAPRVLKSRAMAGEFAFPTRSLVAGSSKG